MIGALLLALGAAGPAADDAAQHGIYRADNTRLIAANATIDAVFMGDSITEGWQKLDPSLFGVSVIDRGISGQTSAQMLARFDADVIALRPRIVHIMAGTNDIALNGGPYAADQTMRNIRRMAEVARSHHISVILASVPPAKGFGCRAGVDPVPAIAALNRRIAAYARANGLDLCRLFQGAGDTAEGAMKPGMAGDGVHPTQQGFAVMTPLAKAAIARR